MHSGHVAGRREEGDGREENSGVDVVPIVPKMMARLRTALSLSLSFSLSACCCIAVVPVVIHFSRGSFVRQHYILLYYYVRR